MSVHQLTQAFYGLLVREQQMRQLQQQQHQYQQQLAASVLRWLPLPLSRVHVSAQCFDFCAEVRVTQTYVNQTSHVLESEYVFPLDEHSAVCAFSAKINGREIHGLVKEKAEARAEFQRAKQQGKATMLLEQAQENVFKMAIGNLAPQSQCEVTLTYLTTLDLQGQANRFVVPSVVAPKYEPHAYYGWNGHLYNGAQPDSRVNGFNGSATVSVTPSSGAGSLGFFQAMTAQYMGQPTPTIVPVFVPPPATIAFKQQHAEPQRFSMKIELLMPSEITQIRSESHPKDIHVTIDPLSAEDSNGSHSEDSSQPRRLTVPHHATVLFGMQPDGSAPSVWPESLGARDFVLTIAQKTYLEARAVLEVDPATGSQAIQLAFCPQSVDLMDASALQTEILFLIDQSGSMGGSSITGVKAALEIFLRSLPVACKFNLISFGSTYKKLFPQAQKYSEASLTKALQYAAQISADLGGTEIEAPLRHCFESSRDSAYPRQIFLLTDGQVSNTQQLVDLTRKHAAHTRLFTFGLGASADRHLVKSLALAGGGACEFISGGSAKEGANELNAKVMRNLIRSMQPSITDVQVDWQPVTGVPPPQASPFNFFRNSSSPSPPVQQCPEAVAPIFPPGRELIYAISPASLSVASATAATAATGQDQIVQLRVTAISNRPGGARQSSSAERSTWLIPINLSRPQHGTFIHKLAARARITEIQNWTKTSHRFQDQQSQVLRLALKYQLMSNYTSFILVDDRRVKKVRSTPRAVPMQQLAHAQVDMFNAFLSSQSQPGKPINANGYAFTQPPSSASADRVDPYDVAPAAAAQYEEEDDEEDEEDCYIGGDYSSFSSEAPAAAPSSSAIRRSSSSWAAKSRPDVYCSVDLDRAGGSFGSARGGSSAAAPRCKSSSSSDSFSFGGAPVASASATLGAENGWFGGGGGRADRSISSGGSREDLLQCLQSRVSSVAESARSFNSSVSKKVAKPSAPPAPARRQAQQLQLQPQCLDLLGGMSSVSQASQAAPTAFFGFLDHAAPPAAPAAFFPSAPLAPPSAAAVAASGPSSTPSLSPSVMFTILLQMATLDGAWNMSPELLRLVLQIVEATGQAPGIVPSTYSLAESRLVELATKLTLSTKALATLLVLFILQQCFADRQHEWMMLAGKAKACLRSQLAVPIDQIDAITQQVVATIIV